MRRRAFILLLGLGLLAGFQFSSFSDDWTVDWYFLDTPNFKVIFHEGLEEEAQEVGNTLEEAYEFWDEKLGVDYNGKFKFLVSIVDVHMAGSTFVTAQQQYIAGAFESGGRFTNQWLSSRNPSGRDMILYHEYGHAVDIFNTHGPTDVMRDIFGSSFISIFGKPLIITEGIVIHAEEERTGYSRANDPREQMLMRQMIVEEEVFTFAELFYTHSREEWPSSYMMTHNVGPWLIRYLKEAYGDDVVRKIEEASSSHPMQFVTHFSRIFGLPIPPIGPDFTQLLEKSIGVSSDDIYQGFNDWMQNQFRSQLGGIFANPVTISEPISPLPIWNYLPTYSPDGEWLAYFHNDYSRGQQIRLMRPDGSEDHSVVEMAPNSTFGGPITDGETPTWAADGKSFILDTFDRFGSDWERNLYNYDLETEQLTRISKKLKAHSPQYTHDGKHIIYVQFGEKGHSHDIYKFNIETGLSELIYDMPDDLWIDLTTLSPDGTQLAMSVWQWGGLQDIYILPLDGSDPVAITQNIASDLDPFWTSDGEYIFFSSDITDVVNLYAYRVSDGNFFQVTNVDSGAFDPAVSPDLSEIIFVGYTTKGYQLEKISYEPPSWTEVTMPEDPIPEKRVYTTQWEVQPYEFREMMPKGWMPSITPGRVGFATDGIDAFSQQIWMIDAGYSFDEKAPDFTFTYRSSRFLPDVPTQFVASFRPGGNSQNISMSYDLFSSNLISHDLSLGLSRSLFGGNESYRLSPGWRGSFVTAKDLLKYRLSLSINGTMTYDVKSSARNHRVIITANNAIRMPVEVTQALRLNITAGWSDSERPAFRVGGKFGPFSIPGIEGGIASGSQALGANIEYALPLWEYNNTVLGTWPLFIQGLRGKFFGSAGVVGPEFSEIHAGIGAEFGLELSLPYLLQFQINFGFAYGIGTEKPTFTFGLGFPSSIF